MTARDIARLAEYLGLPESRILDRYSETCADRIRLKTNRDEYCIFYDKGCGVHPGRPDICRAWPFFRGNLLDRTSWEMIQEYCPGVNKDAGHAQFVLQGRAHLVGLGVEDLGEDAPAALKIPED
jgi:Fe-S-cluster containining protein